MRLIIVGAGNQAELAYQVFRDAFDVFGFAVEREFRKTDQLHNIPVLDLEDVGRAPYSYAFHVAITFDKLNATRTRLYQHIKSLGYLPASYIAPSSIVPSTSKLGEHVFISPLNNIDDYVTIGDNVYLHAQNHIGHHSTIRDNVFISSGVTISGGCDIGENTFIGVNAAIGHNIKIGARSIIGAGTLVTHDVPTDSVIKRSGDKPDGRRSSEVAL